MDNKFKFGNRSDQAGMALITVIVLLLLASLIVLFAVNFGTLAQRISGNDVRSRLVQQTADSALSQASETLLANSSILNNLSLWVACGATETVFPCGAIPASRRASMYRFNGGTSVNGVFPDTSMDVRMLNLNKANLTAVNNFAVNYGVGVVMCRLKPAATGVAPTCSTDASEAVRVFAITLVAIAAMPDEGARATAVRSFATSPAFGFSVDSPTTTTSGLLDLKGTLQVVTSPNSGGFGIPVSMWTRGNIAPGGTPDSCQADEFYRSGSPTNYQGILRCDTCTCATESLTNTQGNSCTGGSDLLFGGTSPCDKTNDQVNKTDPNEFPCDLFEYTFGVAAWRDLSPVDNFCETKINVTDTYGTIGADESFLVQKSDWIISANDFGGRLAGDSRVLADCSSLSGKSGIIWDRVGCSSTNGLQIGTPNAPVLLVYDGRSNWHSTLFGLLFVREQDPGPLTGSKDGGTVDFGINDDVALYGSLVVQGSMKANGTAALIYNQNVLENLKNNLNKPDVLALPGSWSDNVRY